MASKSKKFSNGKIAKQSHSVTSEQRHQMIAEAAYYRALSRGFDGGDPMMDWLEAERDVDQAMLNIEQGILETTAATRPAWAAAAQQGDAAQTSPK